MGARVDRTVVSGVFSLDGQDFDVDNNVWLVGDDEEVLVIDAPHRLEPIIEAVGGRRVARILFTIAVCGLVPSRRLPPTNHEPRVLAVGGSPTHASGAGDDVEIVERVIVGLSPIDARDAGALWIGAGPP